MFIHRYVVIKYRSSSINGKIHHLLWELWPFFPLEKWFLQIFSQIFCSISFEKISLLDSYFIYRYIIIKYRSSLIDVKINNYDGSYGPFQLRNIVLRSISYEKISVFDLYLYTDI